MSLSPSPLLRAILVCVGLTFVFSASAEPRLEPLAPDGHQAWQPAEFRLLDIPAAENPFDPEQLRVDARITTPSGRTWVIPAFWHQEFTRTIVNGAEKLTPAGAPHWRLRFTPSESGAHGIVLALHRRDSATPALSTPLHFTVSAAPATASPGWVKIAADRRTFATSDGRPLLFAGHNVCWPQARGTFDYDRWFAEMAAAGQNFARLWLAPWWAGLEHGPGTLNNYRLDAAWQLDHVFATAEKHGIYLLLCLDHHGMYQSSDAGWGGSNNFWPTNPYSAQQGGPCARAADFFRDPAAMKLYQKRLRYLIARYGHSPRLVAWQFFNEIDNIFDRAPVDEATVVNWHVTMARWLKANDPYQHVVGTSLTGGVDRPAFWHLPEMEFTSFHSYHDPAPARRMGALVADFTTRYGKPALIGEFGVDGAAWSPSWDPHLRGFRQNLWAGALGGSAATGLSWWWEDVHADNALGQQAILTRFLREAGWFEGGWSPLVIDGPLDATADLGEPLPNQPTFSADLALNPFRRLRLDGQFAVASPLAAERASEHLSSVLWGTHLLEAGADLEHARRPLRIVVHSGENSRVLVRLKETTGATTLVGRLDGAEIWRAAFEQAGPAAREFSAPLPPGRHVIEIANEGVHRLHLAAIRVENLRPSTFAGGWSYRPEALGLRRGDRALLYVVAPAAVYPAGAIRFELPRVENEALTLPDWPDGDYLVRWTDPKTGYEVASAHASARDGRLTLPLPPFHADLAARIDP